MVDIGFNLRSMLLFSQRSIDAMPNHISLYAAILTCAQQQQCSNTINVRRRELMALSCIKSNATYHKCISELIEWNMTQYFPSYHPRLGSKIILLDFEA